MSVRNRLVLDVALFVAIVLAYAPAATGVSVHEWLSVAIIVPVLVHLIVNWEWVARTTRTFAGRLRATPTVNLVVDAILFVAAVAVSLSGLLISQVVMGALGISVPAVAAWRTVHALSADVAIFALFVHLGLHARWIFRATTSTVERSLS